MRYPISDKRSGPHNDEASSGQSKLLAGILVQFPEWCDHTVARDHTRPGESALISSYLEAIAAIPIKQNTITQRLKRPCVGESGACFLPST